MEFNWSILGWVAGLVFVYVFGLLEGRNQGRKRRIAEEQEEKKKEAPAPETVQVNNPGILRVKNENGNLTLDLDGTRVDTSSLSPNQRKRLIEVLSIMRPWVEGKPAAPPTPSPEVEPTLESRLDAIAPPQATPKPFDKAQDKPAPVSPVIRTQPAPSTSSAKKKNDKPEAAPTTMVGQINAILQAQIANSPLVSRGVSVMESPLGGVNVYVGVNKYEGIDAVPDEEIKAAIRAAIAEWEKKYTPGL